jgi:hypothetical protein
MELVAFKGDIKLKKLMVEEVKKHQEADKIIQGTYGDNGKYCAVGCSIHSLNVRLGKTYKTSDHSVYETELGVPRIIARLEDRIFEGLESKEAKKFPLRFIQAIKPGADLSLVTAKFFVWLLVDPEDGIIKFARPDGKKAIQKVADLYLKKIAGKTVTEKQWRAAAAAYADADADAAAAAAADAAAAYADAAADAAAAYAAYAAAAAYAVYAAYAAYAAADADADAAYAAAYAAYADADADAAAAAAYAYADARRKHYSKMADKLIALLKEAK